MGTSRERRGATLVLVAVMMVVIMGFAAFAIDLGQLYAYQSELQRSADAAALAGAVELTKVGYDTADRVATAYADSNSVEGSPPRTIEVNFGTWDQATQVFTAGAASDAANALQVNLSGGPANPIFAFAGDYGAITIYVSAVGWAAPTIPTHDCIKPFAVRYGEFANYLGANPDLRVNNGTSTPPAPQNWNIESVTLAAGETPDGEITEGCSLAADTLSPGDLLDTLSFALDANASDSVASWCGRNYPATPCMIKVPTWDTTAVIIAGTATDGVSCNVAMPPSPCVLVNAIVPYIVQPGPATPNTGALPFTISGYPTTAIDQAGVPANAASPFNQWIYHPVLAQVQ
jgi:hypothetical protein